VFVEEVSFRARAIEGVPTSTTGFVGVARYGPVHYTGGPTATEPRLITSFTEFERVYGGLAPLRFTSEDHTPYLAHAARAFFLNGGKRLYISRVFQPRDIAGQPDWGVARLDVPVGTGADATTATWW